MKTVFRVLFVVAVALAGFAVAPSACSSRPPDAPLGDGGNDDSGYCYSPPCIPTSSSGGVSDGSYNFQPNQEGGSVVYVGKTGTSISGTVYDPANVNPVYNVTVYVPGIMGSASLPPLPNGVSCNSCSDLYTNPQAAAVTDATGHFSIPDAPPGMNLPLVVQVGKWRMLYRINVTGGQDNPQADHSLHLPKNHMEGDLPNIAISTGGADSLECLLLRMGVDPGEYTAGPGGAGRLHIFTGYQGASTQGGTAYDPGMTLWDKDSDIDPFDVVLLSCEGEETVNMNQQVLLDYGNMGGRVFASHFHYAWFDTGPFATTITPGLAAWTQGVQLMGNINGTIVTTLPNGMPFPEGAAMKQWLGNVGALGPSASSGTPAGELPVVYACHNADVTMSNANSQPWVAADQSAPSANATQYFSFDLPISSNAEGKCGRVVYSDLHVSGGPGVGANPDYPGFNTGGIAPSGCSSHALTPQEKALEFMIFDLSSCLIPPGQTTKTPQVF